MKEYHKSFLFAGPTFGLIIGLYIGIKNNHMMGIFVGAFAAVIFGGISSIFVYFQSLKFRKKGSEIVGIKPIINSGGANHFVGSESVGGWLYLTIDELLFQSHRYNIQNHKTAIPLEQIIEIKPSLTKGIVPNGLEITTIGGVERFVIYKRNEWIQKINEAIEHEKQKITQGVVHLVK
jgi:hypothetical protein